MFIFERQTGKEWSGGQGEGERRERMSKEGAEIEETQNPKQAPDSELSAQSPVLGANSQTMRS